MMPIFTPDSVFYKLPEFRFNNYQELETAVLKAFNTSSGHFPPGFTHRDLIRWGLDQGCIKQLKDGFAIVKT